MATVRNSGATSDRCNERISVDSGIALQQYNLLPITTIAIFARSQQRMQYETSIVASYTFVLSAAEVSGSNYLPQNIAVFEHSSAVRSVLLFKTLLLMAGQTYWATASSLLRFQDHTQTPLDERSARRRDLYLTTQNTHSLPPSGFEPAIPESVQSHTQVLDSANTGIWRVLI